MTFYIASVVEGQTEQGCLDTLLHRVWVDIVGSSESLRVLEPSRSKRDALVDPTRDLLRRKVEEATLKLHAKARKDAAARSLLLILLDAEGDCPATLAPRLLDAARKSLPTVIPAACVLAKRMLENWIVAGASTLAGMNGLPKVLPPRDRFEERSGVKWLETQIRSQNPKRTYKKTVDAKEFVRAMDLRECRANAPSFDKLCRDLQKQWPTSLSAESGTSTSSPSE